MALQQFIRAFPKSRTRCCTVIILFDDSIISALIIVRFIVTSHIMRMCHSRNNNQRDPSGY